MPNVSNEQSKPVVHTSGRLVRRLPRAKFVGFALLFLICLSLGFLGGWIGSRSGSLRTNTPEIRQQVVSSESQLISEIAKNVGPSVVSVNVTSQRSSIFGTGDGLSAGTGFFISEDGVIVTNRHVVPSGATSVSITMSDGTSFSDVSILGKTNEGDPLDIAFLKVKDLKSKKVTPVKFADSSKVKVGEKVVAIGNALGQFQNTVTSGIISGYGRSVQAGDETGQSSEELQNLFQTDTAINQGNSGGPLVNTSGEVIGINTAVAGDAENIGFAIPINDVQGLIDSVLQGGKLLRPYLGVRYISLTDDYAYQYNLSVKRGAYLAPSSTGSVVSGSPAEKAGLKEKDIITKINGTAIDENNSLTSILGRHKVGDKVALTIIRDGKEQTLNATLEASPSTDN